MLSKLNTQVQKYQEKVDELESVVAELDAELDSIHAKTDPERSVEGEGGTRWKDYYKVLKRREKLIPELGEMQRILDGKLARRQKFMDEKREIFEARLKAVEGVISEGSTASSAELGGMSGEELSGRVEELEKRLVEVRAMRDLRVMVENIYGGFEELKMVCPEMVFELEKVGLRV